MSVRKRKWKTRKGEIKTAWIVDYNDDGIRRLETFADKKAAKRFAAGLVVGRKCIVHNCPNTSDAGRFIGDLCSPCHEMLTTGLISQHGDTFLHKLRGRLVYISNKLDETLNTLSTITKHK